MGSLRSRATCSSMKLHDKLPVSRSDLMDLLLMRMLQNASVLFLSSLVVAVEARNGQMAADVPRAGFLEW